MGILSRLERWHDVVDALELDLEATHSPAERADALVALGDARRNHTVDTAMALDAYREALVLDDDHSCALRGVAALLDVPEVAVAAAEVGRPRWQRRGEHELVLRASRLEIQGAPSAEEQLALYGVAVDTAEIALASPDWALDLAVEAMKVAASSGEFETWRARVEQLGRAVGRLADLVEWFESVAADVLDEDAQVAHLVHTARLAR